jgi:hypothetical protein
MLKVIAVQRIICRRAALMDHVPVKHDRRQETADSMKEFLPVPISRKPLGLSGSSLR